MDESESPKLKFYPIGNYWEKSFERISKYVLIGILRMYTTDPIINFIGKTLPTLYIPLLGNSLP